MGKHDHLNANEKMKNFKCSFSPRDVYSITLNLILKTFIKY